MLLDWHRGKDSTYCGVSGLHEYVASFCHTFIQCSHIAIPTIGPLGATDAGSLVLKLFNSILYGNPALRLRLFFNAIMVLASRQFAAYLLRGASYGLTRPLATPRGVD